MMKWPKTTSDGSSVILFNKQAWNVIEALGVWTRSEKNLQKLLLVGFQGIMSDVIGYNEEQLKKYIYHQVFS